MLSTLHTFSHLLPQQYCEGHAIIIPILKMRKLRNLPKFTCERVVGSRAHLMLECMHWAGASQTGMYINPPGDVSKM